MQIVDFDTWLMPSDVPEEINNYRIEFHRRIDRVTDGVVIVMLIHPAIESTYGYSIIGTRLGEFYTRLGEFYTKIHEILLELEPLRPVFLLPSPRLADLISGKDGELA